MKTTTKTEREAELQQRLDAAEQSAAAAMRELENAAKTWERRARETLDVLHAFSGPITQIIQRSWSAGL